MKDKSEIKTYKGYRYITIKMPFGSHVCGYVEIPAGHYLFGKSYLDPIEELKQYNKSILEGKRGKRGVFAVFGYAINPDNKKPLSAEMLFDVHGSITYSDKLMFRKTEPIFDWAFGFDTAHCDDDETTQTHEYCEQECISLIDQIVEFDRKLKDDKDC